MIGFLQVKISDKHILKTVNRYSKNIKKMPERTEEYLMVASLCPKMFSLYSIYELFINFSAIQLHAFSAFAGYIE